MTDIRSVRNGAATIVYRVDGNGPLVVLLASTGRGTEEFGPLARRLAERGYRTLRPEPRGIGGSTGRMDGVSFHDLAGDFAAVIRAEGGGPAIVAGHAYGNWIARTIASDHPELVRGVVLVAACARDMPKELSATIDVIADPSAEEERRLAGLRLAFFAADSDPRPWLEGWHADVTASQRAARRLSGEEWRSAGTVPVLDLQAEADPFRPPETRTELSVEFGDRLSVRLIEGASHALPAEKPEAVPDAVADWAEGLPA